MTSLPENLLDCCRGRACMSSLASSLAQKSEYQPRDRGKTAVLKASIKLILRDWPRQSLDLERWPPASLTMPSAWISADVSTSVLAMSFHHGSLTFACVAVCCCEGGAWRGEVKIGLRGEGRHVKSRQVYTSVKAD